MKRTLRWLVPVASVALLLVVLLSRWSTDPKAPRTHRDHGKVAVSLREFEQGLTPEPSLEPAKTSLRYRFEVGDVLSYRFDSTSDLTLGISGAFASRAAGQGVQVTGTAGQTQKFTFGLSGLLQLTAYESTATEVVLGYRFSDLSVDIAGEGRSADAAVTSKIENEAADEVLVIASPVGRISEIWFPKGMGTGARNLTKGLILQATLVLPETEAAGWEAREEDTSGEYVARYTLERNCRSDGRVYARVTREKDRYTRLFFAQLEAVANAAMKCNVTTRGKTQGLFDVEQGSWKGVEVDEQLRVEGVEFAQDVQVASRATLFLSSRTHEEAVSRQAAARMEELKKGGERSGPAGPEGALAIAREAQEERWRELVKGATVDGLLLDLARFQGQGMPESREAYEAWEKLSILFRLDDKAVARVLLLRTNGAVSTEVQEAVAGALGSAGTPPAQEALMEILSSAGTAETVRDSAMAALSLVARPTQGSEDFLRRKAQGAEDAMETRQSLVGLGAYARSVSQEDPGRSSGIIAFLLESEKRSQGAEWKRSVLDALGNAGARETLEVVTRYLGDADEGTRASAASALRFVEDASVEDRLAKVLDADSSSMVRAAAAHALGYRSGARVEEILTGASRHADEQVRRCAIEYFARYVGDDERAREVVTRMSVEDPSPELRSLALDVLQGR